MSSNAVVTMDRAMTPDQVDLIKRTIAVGSTNDGLACSPACAEVLRQAEVMHDARNLAQVALLKDEADPLVGLAWLHFQWRPYAVGEEITVRDMAIEILSNDCTAAEWAVWTTLRSNPAVASMAQALEFKHTYTRQLAETMRLAA